MEPVFQILPELIGDPKSKPVKKGRRRTPLGFGTRQLFPPLEILRPAWEHIVGKRLVDLTRPISVVAGKLVVEVPSVAWRVQLVCFEKPLVLRIQHLLGDDAITGIAWKVNPVLCGASQDGAPPRIPPREADQAVRAEAAKIADPELRELFLRQAARMSS